MLDRRTVLTSGLTAGLTTALAVGATGISIPLLGAQPAAAAPRVVTTLASGLEVPWGLTFLPGGDALVGVRSGVFLVRRTGRFHHVGRIPDFQGPLISLRGIVAHPRFSENRWVYLFAHRFNGDTIIIRSKFLRTLEFGPPQLVYDGIPWGRTNNGGRLRFGPDGMLYVGTGDAGSPGLAQSRRSPAGKILRMSPTGRVPRDNPFNNRVWSYGHRNVQGLDWDSSGRLWAVEPGQAKHDELNQIVPGRNYGWPRAEGSDGPGGYHDPFVTWIRETCIPGGLAIVGNRAYVGAIRGRALWVVTLSGAGARKKVRTLHHELGRIRTVEAAPDGSLWVTTSNKDEQGIPEPGDDRVVRVVV